MKKSKVGKVFHRTCSNPMFGIHSIEYPIVFYTKEELHNKRLPDWSKLNTKSFKEAR